VGPDSGRSRATSRSWVGERERPPLREVGESEHSTGPKHAQLTAADGQRVDVPIELPPQWVALDATELTVQRAWIRNELREREAAVKKSRIERGLRRPKPERCLTIDPFERPARPARRPAPLCFAATELARRDSATCDGRSSRRAKRSEAACSM
jgi:hypothetical protein